MPDPPTVEEARRVVVGWLDWDSPEFDADLDALIEAVRREEREKCHSRLALVAQAANLSWLTQEIAAAALSEEGTKE